jgi:hypothetical protein
MWFVALLPALLAVPAAAQTVYRCGPEGREYSQTPCKDGRAVDAGDPRSAADRREAREIAAREAQLADKLARENRAREAEAARTGAAGIQPAPKPASAAASSPHKKKKSKAKAAAEGEDTMSPPIRLPAPSKPTKPTKPTKPNS